MKNLQKIIDESVKKTLNELTRRQKAQRAIQGKMDTSKIKSIGILSAENPMAQTLSDKENQPRREDLIKTLSIGHFVYYQTKGSYGGPENSVIIYNISLDDLLYLGQKYGQESVIYIDCSNAPALSYQFWEREGEHSPYKKTIDRHEIIDATNDTDYFTKISKKFKFRIPFFEHSKKIGKMIAENCSMNPAKLLDESMNDNFTGKHKYICRSRLYGKSTQL